MKNQLKITAVTLTTCLLITLTLKDKQVNKISKPEVLQEQISSNFTSNKPNTLHSSKSIVQKTKKKVTTPFIELESIQEKWRKNFPNAELVDQQINQKVKKVARQRNKEVIVRETLLKVNMKYPNIVAEETYVESDNGSLVLIGYVEYVANHILVKINKIDNAKYLQEAFSGTNVTALGTETLYKVDLASITIDTVKDAIKEYEEDNTVKYAEADYLVRNSSTNDPHYDSLWGLHNSSDTDIDAPEAWTKETGSHNVLVGVIDTGIDYNHIDLKDNIWKNPGETGTDDNGANKATNGIDDDGNGFIDDVYGWDFAEDDNNPMDIHDHGTHCAGTIGASANNSVGVVGVAHKVRLMALKFLNPSGYTSDAIRAVNYASLMGVDLTSNSWGGGGYSQSLKNAIDEAVDRNILFVAAAGNSGLDIDSYPSYPAAYSSSNIISVAASDRYDQLASFSNYGASHVDLAAPGVGILSTTPGDSYRYFSGTSMATPHVSGVAALIRSQNSSITVTDLKDRIMNSTDPISEFTGKMITGGRLNANQALELTAGTAAIITSPSNGKELTSSTVTFTFNQGENVTALKMTIGSTLGASDLFNDEQLIGLNSVSLELSADGRQIYLRLSSLIAGEWVHRDSTYYTFNPNQPVPEKSILTSPSDDTKLRSGDITFHWSEGSLVDRNWLYIGTYKGYGDLHSAAVYDGSSTVNLTIYTEKIYVRLWSYIESQWQYNDYEFDTMDSRSAITSPVSGSTFTSEKITIHCTEGYNIDSRYLMVGSSKGYGDISSSYMTGLKKTIKMPIDGSQVYVRLWSKSGSSWGYLDYEYTSATISPKQAVITSPKARKVFGSEYVTFRWTEGTGVSHKYMYIRSSKKGKLFRGYLNGTKKRIKIPTGSGTIYVYFYSRIDGVWKKRTYIYYAKDYNSSVLSPVRGSKIYNNRVTFKWTKGVAVRSNKIMIGTRRGRGNLYNRKINGTKATVNIKAKGKIYVRLYSYRNGRWRYNDYVYKK